LTIGRSKTGQTWIKGDLGVQSADEASSHLAVD
jgi:hypothetical protein